MLKTLAIIPARGGSKGIPRKNVRLVAGKPLVAHSIEHARNTPAIQRVIVSTDDQEIADVARQYGAEVVLRPADISGDTATSESALVHVLDTLKEQENYEPDRVVFLQCKPPPPFWRRRILRRRAPVSAAPPCARRRRRRAILAKARFTVDASRVACAIVVRDQTRHAARLCVVRSDDKHARRRAVRQAR